jgi:hypothetical protein
VVDGGGGEGRRSKDDRKQNTVAPLLEVLATFLKNINGCPFKRISLIMNRTIWDISSAEVWKNSILTCSPTASRFYSDTGKSSMCCVLYHKLYCREYHSLCPLIGIGTPPCTPSPASECAPPPGSAPHSPADKGVAESKFRRIEIQYTRVTPDREN